MKQFHGTHKKHSFFEGWYLKHQNKDTTISFIPAYHIDSKGASSLSIQIITPEYNGQILLPGEQFLFNQNCFSVQLGKNHFSHAGISVDIQTVDFSVSGTLSYQNLTPPETDIMGPFRHLSFLQCNHGLLSLTHQLQGTLTINGAVTDFSGGTGYIEKDWGSSFPQSYLWTQGSFLSASGSPCCVMLSIAHIPFLGTHFTGCISSVFYEGREYRLATYRCASIDLYTSKKAVLSQGDYQLSAELLSSSSRPLYAPSRGNMTRQILESVSCPVHYRFTVRNQTLFDLTVPDASFEASGLDSASN